MTGEPPFAGMKRNEAILAAQCCGELPRREHYQSLRGEEHDDLWNMLTSCWNINPDKRPTLEEACTVPPRLIIS